MTDDQPIILDPCYPPSCDLLRVLRQKRIAHFLALKKAQSDDRDFLDYLDYRIEIARQCVQDEMGNGSCGFGTTDDFYHQ